MVVVAIRGDMFVVREAGAPFRTVVSPTIPGVDTVDTCTHVIDPARGRQEERVRHGSV